MNDFNIPVELSEQGKSAAEAIVALMTAELANPSEHAWGLPYHYIARKAA